MAKRFSRRMNRRLCSLAAMMVIIAATLTTFLNPGRSARNLSNQQSFLAYSTPLTAKDTSSTKDITTTYLDYDMRVSEDPKANSLPGVAPKLHTKVNLANVTRKVAFVHVGKAGGNTVRAAFPRLCCRKRRTAWDPGLARCFRKHRRRGSPFSQQCDLEIHMGGRRPKKELQEYTTFLYAIRNPVTRAISAYSYLHHNNTNSPTAQSKHYLKEYFYKSCFPTLQHLLDTLREAINRHTKPASASFLEDSSPSKHPEYCRKMAIAVLKGKNSLVDNINVHLRDNYQFYYRKTIKAFPDKEVLAVRTENLWTDIEALDIATGGVGRFDKTGAVANENVKTKEFRQDPTPEQLRDLCCTLWEDIETYQEIVNLARNLPYHSKLQTMQDVWSTCGIDNFERNHYQQEEKTATRKRVRTGGTEQRVVFSWFMWYQDKCTSSGLS